MGICPAYISKYTLDFEKRVNFLMIPNEKVDIILQQQNYLYC